MDKYDTLADNVHEINFTFDTTFSINNEKENFNKNLQLSKKCLEEINEQLLTEIPENERETNSNIKMARKFK